MKKFALIIGLLFITGCSTVYPNKDITGLAFPVVTGQSLEKNTVAIPTDFKDEMTLLLIGYKQNSQFDIDRWLIALDMTETKVSAYEIPTIQGLFPQMFSTVIDNGMRAGIPKPLWKGVITVYSDGDKVQAFTGNENASNARVVLLNKQGKVVYFYDQGFAVAALNKVRSELASQP